MAQYPKTRLSIRYDQGDSTASVTCHGSGVTAPVRQASYFKHSKEIGQLQTQIGLKNRFENRLTWNTPRTFK